jgi:hypothetical protein
MTELSSYAQAILDAYQFAPVDDHLTAAAVLRAVAYQLQLDKPLGDTDADAGVFAAHHAIKAHILAVADELEQLDA